MKISKYIKSIGLAAAILLAGCDNADSNLLDKIKTEEEIKAEKKEAVQKAAAEILKEDLGKVIEVLPVFKTDNPKYQQMIAAAHLFNFKIEVYLNTCDVKVHVIEQHIKDTYRGYYDMDCIVPYGDDSNVTIPLYITGAIDVKDYGDSIGIEYDQPKAKEK